jgi:hypothetical protein
MFRTHPTPIEAASAEHPTQAKSGCEKDRRIRAFGWAIFSRPNGHEPRWRKGGEVLPESVVLRVIEASIRAVEEAGR